MPGPGLPTLPPEYPEPLEPDDPLEADEPEDEPLDAENWGAGIPERPVPLDEPPEALLEPDLEPYVGAGPTGAVLLGTAIENGLFGTCESFGACALGGVKDGLKLGLKLGDGALTGCGLAGAFCTGFCVTCFVTVFCGAGACFFGCCTFLGAEEGEATDFLVAFEGALGIDTTLFGSCFPPALEFLSERYLVFLFIGIASF